MILNGDPQLKIFSNENEITPMIIQELLRKSKSLEHVEVKGIKITRTFSTLTSNICLIKVNYSNKSHIIAPKSLFLKMSREDYFNPEVIKNEVVFYNTVASQKGVLPIIPCYDAKFDENTGRSHIILEDVSKTHFQTDWPIPPTNINCERHIEGLAKLHAFWWDNERLEEIMDKNDWIKHFDYEKEVKKKERLLQEFLNFIGNRISKPRKNILKISIEYAVRYLWESYVEGENLTLCHGDAHAWNALYPKDDINGNLYFMDWQDVWVFKGASDLAYFMALHWSPERRKRLEALFLRKYHEILKKSGIKDYSWKECYKDYRSAIILFLHDAIVEWWSAKNVPPSVWWYHSERALSAFEDLNCKELIKLKKE